VSHRVVFAPQAEAHLIALYRFIAQEASPEVAEAFATAIVVLCESLETFPHRGTPHGWQISRF
jgi:toxin ParE1/3/4